MAEPEVEEGAAAAAPPVDEGREEATTTTAAPAAVAPCPHLSKCVKASQVANIHHIALKCQHCYPGNNKSSYKMRLKAKAYHAKHSNGFGDDSDSEAETVVNACVCLKCGIVLCGRSTEEQHAMHHHGANHHILAEVTSGTCWCFECEREIHRGESAAVDKCLDTIGKLVKKRFGSLDLVGRASNGGVVGRCSADGLHPVGQHYLSSHYSSMIDVRRQTGVKGLPNLGNTCFFNSVTQAINRSVPLREHLSRMRMGKASSVSIVPTERVVEGNKLPVLKLALDEEMGPTTDCLEGLVHSMHDGDAKNGANPRALFQNICQVSPQFRGYQQQDAQELLRTLLDQLDTEQRKRIRRSLRVHFELPADEREAAEATKALEDTAKRKLQAYERGITTYVDHVFGGRIASTVVCTECRTPSRVVEGFLDLSIPISEAPRKSHTLTLRKRRSKAKSSPEVSPNSSPPMTRRERSQQKKRLRLERKQQKKRLRKSRVRAQASGDDLSDADGSSEATTLDGSFDKGHTRQRSDGSQVSRDSDAAILASSDIDSIKSLNIGQTIAEIDNETDSLGSFGFDSSAPNSAQVTDNEGAGDPYTQTANSVLASASICLENLQLGSSSDATLPKVLVNGLLNSEFGDSVLDDDGGESPSLPGAAEPSSLPASPEPEPASPEPAPEPEDDTPQEIRPPLVPGTLVDPFVPRPGECSVQSCLSAFCQEEILEGNNLFCCEACFTRRQERGSAAAGSSTASGEAGARASDRDGEGSAEPGGPPAPKFVKTVASKQMLIEMPPRILTLHLKRFEQHGYRLQKLAKHVDFPTVLDIAPFCSTNCSLSVYDEGVPGIRYGLFAVVEHAGRLNGGHYTAYVKDVPAPAPAQPPHGDPGMAPKPKWFYISDSHVREVTEAQVLNSQAYILFYERYH